MKKSFLKIAAVAAASILSGFSFVSCDDDDKFESKTFTVELPKEGDMPGYMPVYHYKWDWTNYTEAAADSIGFVVEPNGIVDHDTVMVGTYEGSPYKELWTFRTKETGVREVKFRYMKVVTPALTPDGDDTYVNFTVLKDTVIKF